MTRIRTLDYKKPPVYEEYKGVAERRKIAFELTRNDYTGITSKSCCYCGKDAPNGVDLIDDTLGYVTENCVPCCKQCNYAKSNLPINDFQKWIKRIVEKHCP